ncbi:Hypothetical protein D9617_77g092410 [Elsinoe fawcettii]|nr:Hypothetical protein D9617_77g092410 [Elsinoe fawcettii]
MSEAPSPFAGNPRAARPPPLPAGVVQNARVCERCAAGVAQGLVCEGGNFSLFGKKKCTYCVRLKHKCFPLPPHLRGAYERAQIAVEALGERPDGAAASQEARAHTAACTAAAKPFKDQLKAWHTNKNKITGEASTPGAGVAGASHAGPLEAEKVKELQKIRRAMTALVALVLGVGGEVDAIDHIMGGGEYGGVEEAEGGEGEGEGDDDDDDDE